MEHLLDYVYHVVEKKYKMMEDKEFLVTDYQKKYKTSDNNIIFPLIAEDFVSYAKKDLMTELIYQFEPWFKSKCEKELNAIYADEITG